MQDINLSSVSHIDLFNEYLINPSLNDDFNVLVFDNDKFFKKNFILTYNQKSILKYWNFDFNKKSTQLFSEAVFAKNNENQFGNFVLTKLKKEVFDLELKIESTSNWLIEQEKELNDFIRFTYEFSKEYEISYEELFDQHKDELINVYIRYGAILKKKDEIEKSLAAIDFIKQILISALWIAIGYNFCFSFRSMVAFSTKNLDDDHNSVSYLLCMPECFTKTELDINEKTSYYKSITQDIK